jgi:hypothetical protein
MNQPKTIQISGQDFTVKQSFRTFMMFEERTKKSISDMSTSIQDLVTLMYCSLSANNKDSFKYTFDEFVDILDNQPDIVNQFSKYLEEQAAEQTKESKKKAK